MPSASKELIADKNTIKEKDFYNICDFAEGIKNDFTNGYYPSVQELINKGVENNIDIYLPILAYFSSNPFKRLGMEEAEDEDYKELVRYCSHLISSIPLS